VALFALAVQLVVSFGHVHLHRPAAPAAGGVSLLQTASRNETPPAHHGDADDVCAICATIALVASSALPEPVQLTPPDVPPSAWIGELAHAAPVFDLHTSFQARAPPAVG
jgi:hypothetical protein